MHPSQSPFAGIERDAALYELRIEAVNFDFFLAPDAGKETAVVMVGLGFNFKYLWQLSFVKEHI